MATTPGGTTAIPQVPTQNVEGQRNAPTLDAVREAFRQLGLESLAGQVEQLYREGIVDADSILFRLRETEAYKKRFAANEARRKKGLPELTPAAYVELENKYRELMQAAYLPTGFYDQPDDFRKLIENDLSPAEVQARVTWAKEASSNADPALKASLRQMYGINDADVVAYFLDADRATALAEKRYNAAQFNASARRYGVQVDTSLAEEGGLLGSTRDELDQRFGELAKELPTMERLSGVYGDGVTAGDLTREAFGMDGAGGVEKRKRRLASQERAAFGGTAGADGRSLGGRSQV